MRSSSSRNIQRSYPTSHRDSNQDGGRCAPSHSSGLATYSPPSKRAARSERPPEARNSLETSRSAIGYSLLQPRPTHDEIKQQRVALARFLKLHPGMVFQDFGVKYGPFVPVARPGTRVDPDDCEVLLKGRGWQPSHICRTSNLASEDARAASPTFTYAPGGEG